ncbi:MAG TPA: VWA domain-containing protein, partial [Campylobacterales bacterium]|nr:VWA domain-containing protein [Campylobacterales bacterium]
MSSHISGHRKKGDCNDIESVIPVGQIDKNEIISTVNKIQPKGKTPIARSLKKVADELKYTEEKATIILISDGKESCDSNPCDVAKDLEKKGIDFVTHVIGFNVDKKTDKQLECIAKATGGEYFSAKNASALNNAIKSIVKKVEKEKPKPTPVLKKLKDTLEVVVTEKEGGKWVRASNDVIYKDDNGEKGKNISSFTSYKDEVGKTKIPVGKYILRTTYNQFEKETPFEVKAGEVTKLKVVMGETGKVEISASKKEGGKWVIANHWIYPVVDGEKDSSNIAS